MTKDADIRILVRGLGPQGAKAGLLESKIWHIEDLRESANKLGIKVGEKATRKDLIEQIVKVANRRIEKSLDELYKMSFEQLKTYLDQIGAEPEEILDLLKELNLSPQRREGRANLIEFFARELSETGRFMRIAGQS